eukprot:927037-Prymnesium_polylepis.2
MEELSEAVHRRGGLFCEAPVSGSKGPAATGQLVFMVAGDEDVYTAAAAEWDAMGKAAIYCGAVGKGTQLKLVVNMVMGTQLAAIAEGLALGRTLGLDGAVLQDGAQQRIASHPRTDAFAMTALSLCRARRAVLEQGAMASPMLKLKGPLMAAGDYAANFPLKYALKDLEFALDEARAAASDGEDAEVEEEVEAMLPVSSAATGLFVEANEAGLGDLDFAAVYETLK